MWKNSNLRVVVPLRVPTVRRSATRKRKVAEDVFAKFRKLTITSTRRHLDSMSRRTGISGALAAALWEIKRAPGLRICELSWAMAIQQSTASNLVDKLMKGALVKRSNANAAESDRRAVRYYLTRKGERLVTLAPKPSRILLQDILTKLDPEALDTLNDLLDSLIRRLEGFTERSSRPLTPKSLPHAA